MANYVLTLSLKTEKWQEDILEKRLNIARQIYNACLGEILSRYKLMKRQKILELAEDINIDDKLKIVLQRKIADKRKQSHNKLANHILSLGLDVRVENMNFKGLQKRAKETTVNEKTGKINRKKRFGKSLSNKAPSMLITIIDNKLQYFGLNIKKIDTYKVKASQFEHLTETYVKKPLSERWNKFEQGNIQRDMYSAFLIMNTKDNLKEIDVARANATFENFFKLHNNEIDRIKNLDKKQLSSIGL